jgi:hypothetical protein
VRTEAFVRQLQCRPESEYLVSIRVHNGGMKGRTRAIGLTALVAFLAITAWSAGIIPSPCCSAACQRCPITLCAATTAEASPKVDLATAQMPVIATSPLFDQTVTITALVAQVPALLSHEFRRPMRN